MSQFQSKEEFEQWKAERRAARPTAHRKAQAAPPAAVNEQDLEKAQALIRQAWLAGITSGVATLIVVVISVSGYQIMDFDIWGLVDVGLIFLLTFGIYKKSRTAALLLFLYFVASKILIFTQDGKPYGLIGALIFGYFYLMGVIGTFSYRSASQGGGSSNAWRPVVTAISIISLFVTMFYGKTIGLPFDLSSLTGIASRTIAVADWKEFSPPDSSFSVEMLGTPALKKETIDTEAGKMDLYTFTLDLGIQEGSMSVQYAEMPEMLLSMSEIMVNSSRDAMVQSLKGRLVSEQTVNMGRYSGKEFHIEAKDGEMRTRSVIADQRIYQVFATTAKGKAYAEHVNRFFGSFRLLSNTQQSISTAAASAATWQQFSSPEGRFSVEMPGVPVMTQQIIQAGDGKIPVYKFSLDFPLAYGGQNGSYSIQYADIPGSPPKQTNDVDALLNGARNGDIDNFKGALVSETPLVLDGFPGREVHIAKDDAVMNVRIYLVGQRLYKIIVVMPKYKVFTDDDKRFMTSFKLKA